MARADYGIDAPYVPFGLGLGALALLGLAAHRLSAGSGAVPPLAAGLWLAASAGSYLYTTRRGKLVVWGELLDGLGLRGDERVLDVGCGRGAVLVQAAKRVPRGKVVGLDLWSSKDQSGNAEAVTRQNAEREGVADRVELHTGDMRTMPFADRSFDLVVSSLAVHNIADSAGRAAAVGEAYRVLKPGGRLLLADFRHADEYVKALRALNAPDLSLRPLGLRFWYGGPWAATLLVSAKKG